MTDTIDDDRRPPRGRGRAPSKPGPGAGGFRKPGPAGGYRDKPAEAGRSRFVRRPREDDRGDARDGGPPRKKPFGAPPRPSQRKAPAGPQALAPVENAAPAEERIAKVIARAGLASRRDAEAMIEAGRVRLNGEPVTSPALNVGPEARIEVDGEPLPSRERTRLWLFHKPRGLVTTFRDPEGRPTVFDSLPEDMPRVVAIGRLDINTEGLLLLTNDGGLAKVIAHPETGWTRRYRARARGEVSQADLDKLRKGVKVDEMEYGPVEATLDRVQGDNTWLSIALREGKNREVKRILEHLGLQVNRLIRLSFGPFQLGDIEPGLVEEVRTKVLKEQLGAALAAEAGADFESPVREPIAPFGREPAPSARPARTPRPRRAGEDERDGPRGRGFPPRDGDARGGRERGRPPRERPGAGDPRGGRERDNLRGKPREERGRDEGPRNPVWRADDDSRVPRPPRRDKRADPKAERAASAERPRSRARPIETGEGKRVLVERLKPTQDEKPRHRREWTARDTPEEARPGRPPRGTSFGKPGGRGPGGGERGGRGGVPSRNKPGRFGGPPGREGGGKPFRGGPPKGRGG